MPGLQNHHWPRDRSAYTLKVEGRSAEAPQRRTRDRLPQHDAMRAFYSEECSLIIAIYICISFELITLQVILHKFKMGDAGI